MTVYTVNVVLVEDPPKLDFGMLDGTLDEHVTRWRAECDEWVTVEGDKKLDFLTLIGSDGMANLPGLDVTILGTGLYEDSLEEVFGIVVSGVRLTEVTKVVYGVLDVIGAVQIDPDLDTGLTQLMNIFREMLIREDPTGTGKTHGQ